MEDPLRDHVSAAAHRARGTLQFRLLVSILVIDLSLAMAFAVSMCLELLPYTKHFVGVFSDSIPEVGDRIDVTGTSRLTTCVS